MYRTLIFSLILICAASSADARRYRQRTMHAQQPAAASAKAPTPISSAREGLSQSKTSDLVPAGWSLDPPDSFWKGQRYRSPKKDATLLLYSTSALGERFDQHWKDFAFRPEEDLRQLLRGHAWVTATGTVGTQSFYRKAVFNCRERAWVHIELVFQNEARALLEPVIERVSTPFDSNSIDCTVPNAGDSEVQISHPPEISRKAER
jgi:hypothetical protein